MILNSHETLGGKLWEADKLAEAVEFHPKAAELDPKVVASGPKVVALNPNPNLTKGKTVRAITATASRT
jgi:hypothetical protein